MKEILNDPQKLSEFLSRPENLAWFIPLLIILLVLKLVCLWKTARSDQKIWFIVIGVANTLGILEIVYLIRQIVKERKNQKTLA